MRRLTALAIAIAISGSAWAKTPADTLIVARSIDDIVSLDPAESFEITATNTLVSLYQRLLEPDRQNPSVLVPALAQSWTAGSDDKSLVFKLRSGATFSSGNAVRPEDVIYSFKRVVKLNKTPSFILGELGWTADNIDGFLTKVDENHVKVAWPAGVGSAFALSILSASCHQPKFPSTWSSKEWNPYGGSETAILRNDVAAWKVASAKRRYSCGAANKREELQWRSIVHLLLKGELATDGFRV
ncbi:hypothetical protein K5D56_23300 [Pseudomonas cichorii]|nr:hypothetical protein [Pseudomonas cichorii]